MSYIKSLTGAPSTTTLIVNKRPYFVKSLASSYTFDLAITSEPTSINLGKMIDDDSDEFTMKVSSLNYDDPMTLTKENDDSFVIRVDKTQAIVGSYTFNVEVAEVILTATRYQNIKVRVEVIDSAASDTTEE